MNRSTLIKLVHAGARNLFGDDEEARRAWQCDRTRSNRHPDGHASCSNMTNADMENLVAELRRKGALEPRGAPKRAGRVPFNRSPYMDKIEAQLADMGLSWQYAERIAYQVTGGKGEKPNTRPGIKRLEWVRKAGQFRAIIAALSVEQEKRNGMKRIEELLQRLGKDITHAEAMIPKSHHNKWQRNRGYLETVIECLSGELADREET